jgi:thiosulfate dehydrogenase [quinone] large subunit
MTAVIHTATGRPTHPGNDVAATAGTTTRTATRYVLAGLRLALGWIFLWAVIDKLFGLGFATPAKNAWIDGGSPTTI